MKDNFKLKISESRQETIPKEVVVYRDTMPTGRSSLTIRENRVITTGSLSLSLEELKQLIQKYEELE